MTDSLTSWFIAATAVIIIAYDIWIVWSRGGKSTISWTMASWWMTHPFVMVGVFALIGHMFFPGCAPAGQASTQSVSAEAGTTVGLLASALICVFVAHTIREPPEGASLSVHRSYLFRLAALAFVGVLAGHHFFTQYVVCQ